MPKLNISSQTASKAIRSEISEKGFAVYEYISIYELADTLKNDYMRLINQSYVRMSVVLLFVTFVPLGIGVSLDGVFYLFLLCIFFWYIVIFAFIFRELFKNTLLFFKASNVILFDTGIFIGEHFLNYNSEQNLEEELKKYETVFHEKIGEKSNLKSTLSKREENFSKRAEDQFYEMTANSKVSERIFLFFYFCFLQILVNVFYYVGSLLFYGIFGIFFITISVIEKRKNRDVIMIKKMLTNIDKSIQNLKLDTKNIQSTISSFNEGNIKNVNKQMSNLFKSFYDKLTDIVQESNALKNSIHKTSFASHIKIDQLFSHIKEKYDQPILALKTLLKNQQKTVDKKLAEIQKLLQIPSNNKHQLTQKIVALELMQKNINVALKKLPH